MREFIESLLHYSEYKYNYEALNHIKKTIFEALFSVGFIRRSKNRSELSKIEQLLDTISTRFGLRIETSVRSLKDARGGTIYVVEAKLSDESAKVIRFNELSEVYKYCDKLMVVDIGSMFRSVMNYNPSRSSTYSELLRNLDGAAVKVGDTCVAFGKFCKIDSFIGLVSIKESLNVFDVSYFVAYSDADSTKYICIDTNDKARLIDTKLGRSSKIDIKTLKMNDSSENPYLVYGAALALLHLFPDIMYGDSVPVVTGSGWTIIFDPRNLASAYFVNAGVLRADNLCRIGPDTLVLLYHLDNMVNLGIEKPLPKYRILSKYVTQTIAKLTPGIKQTKFDIIRIEPTFRSTKVEQASCLGIDIFDHKTRQALLENFAKLSKPLRKLSTVIRTNKALLSVEY